MSNPNPFTPEDRIGFAAISGKRPTATRPFAKLALGAAFIFGAAALAPTQAHASSWYASPNTSANVYDTQSSLQSQNVQTGTIVGMRPVTVRQNTSANGGTLVGGLIGAAVGNQVSRHTSGPARTLSMALGGVAGGYAGTRISNSVSTHQAMQIFVRDDRTKRTIAIVQDNDQPGIYVGAEVALVRSRNGLAATPLNLPRDQPEGYANDGNARYSNEGNARYSNQRSSNVRYEDDNGGQVSNVRYVRDDGYAPQQSNNDAVVQKIINTRYRP